MPPELTSPTTIDHPGDPTDRPNILFITLDQIRADALGCVGQRQVHTPWLDELAAAGTRFARHYSQAAPCAPGRASIYTGMYQFNHRVMANGTPLEAGFDNIALMARRQGYTPLLFGYTDQAPDPRVTSIEDLVLATYEGFLPGFDVQLPLTGEMLLWRRWLEDLGHHIPTDTAVLIASESTRPAEHSLSAFLTDHALEHLSPRGRPWFAHLSYLRPHPPYAAAGHFAQMYTPAEMPAPVTHRAAIDPLHAFLMEYPATAAPPNDGSMAALIAQYYGMVSEVDAQIGRLITHLRATGQWDRTWIILTADHAEHLGDHGMMEKGGYFESSYHIPCLIKPGAIASAGDAAPRFGRAQVVEQFTENVDLFPTLCEALGAPIPLQCDGRPLTELLMGQTPADWRHATHYEYDWRFTYLGPGTQHPWPRDRRLERQHLTVHRSESLAYVHFASGKSLCFDLAGDPTWRTLSDDPLRRALAAEAMLAWRVEHSPRGLTGTLIDRGVLGRTPELR